MEMNKLKIEWRDRKIFPVKNPQHVFMTGYLFTIFLIILIIFRLRDVERTGFFIPGDWVGISANSGMAASANSFSASLCTSTGNTTFYQIWYQHNTYGYSTSISHAKDPCWACNPTRWLASQIDYSSTQKMNRLQSKSVHRMASISNPASAPRTSNVRYCMIHVVWLWCEMMMIPSGKWFE